MFNFEKLEVWQRAIAFTGIVSHLVPYSISILGV